MNRVLWISWERQRRTVELANALQCKLEIIEYKGYFRYIKLITTTIKLVKKTQPNVLIVQNPSMILAFFSVVFLKRFFSLSVIVDRHSNFLLTAAKRSHFFELLYNFLSFVTIRYADLTIVTNAELAHCIKILGGNPLVLCDKIPSLSHKKTHYFAGERKVLFISTFSSDEPIEEVLQAFCLQKLSSYSLYITGDTKKSTISPEQLPNNVTLTGFLPDVEYIDLLFQVDLVIVLSKQDYTLLCGCYEAISAEKPLITSNTLVLRNFFPGAALVENDCESIADAIIMVFDDLKLFEIRSIEMKKKISLEWGKSFELLKNTVNLL